MINISSECVNSIGLICDMFGAIFVAWEVVRQYQGEKHLSISVTTFADISVGSASQKTEKFKKWEKNKYNIMKIGLILLIVGFILQIISNYIK